MNHSPNNITPKDNTLVESPDNEISSFSGSLTEKTLEEIPISLNYEIIIRNKVSNEKVLHHQNDTQEFQPLEEVAKILKQILVNHFKPIISSQTIIAIPESIKQHLTAV